MQNYNTILLPKLQAQKVTSKVREKSILKPLEMCLLRVTTDLIDDWWSRPESIQTVELPFAVKGILAKLVVKPLHLNPTGTRYVEIFTMQSKIW